MKVKLMFSEFKLRHIRDISEENCRQIIQKLYGEKLKELIECGEIIARVIYHRATVGELLFRQRCTHSRVY